MARQRLSWDEDKVAGITKTADPYTMNQDRQNPPIQKYETGNPSAWAEDPHMATPWKTEGRTETGHPAPAREAVKAARKLEDKALKTITIAQRMLPGADDDMIEKQATLLMDLPEDSVVATLQLQNELAAKFAAEEKEEEMEDEEKKEAGKEEEKEEEEEKKEAGKKKEEEEEEMKEAGKEEKKEDEYEEEEKKEATDLLDSIFETPETKTGAKKLSGIVKQASSGGDPLDRLWDSPPDVSKVFGK